MSAIGAWIRKVFTPTMPASTSGSLSTVPGWSGGWYRILEPFTGAWQRGMTQTPENVLTFSAAYACVTLIASDIAKLPLRLVEQDANGVWNEATSAAFSPVLRKPNRYQTRIDFYESWLLSKLIHGNAYVLKERDNRGVVIAQYVLEPTRVQVKVAPDGSVYYAISSDPLIGLTEAVVVPASEIIHDVMATFYHPLCGISPITACGLAAIQGLKVLQHSSNFFEHGAQPGGLLTVPGRISAEEAREYQQQWESQYGGDNSGKVAVLGGGLTYQPMTMTAVDSQLIEQLKLSAEQVCTAFKVPGYMVGVGPAPAYNNVEALNQQYYSQCLQILIEKIELLQDEGLGLVDVPSRTLGTEFDLDELLRMDTATRVKAAADAVGSGNISPNESRKKYFGLGPVVGGESPMLQQQNYSLAALAKRNAGPDPFGTTTPSAPKTAPAPEPTTPKAITSKDVEVAFLKRLAA